MLQILTRVLSGNYVDCDICDERGNTLLHCLEDIKIIKKITPHITYRANHDGVTPLDIAISKNKWDLVTFFSDYKKNEIIPVKFKKNSLFEFASPKIKNSGITEFSRCKMNLYNMYYVCKTQRVHGYSCLGYLMEHLNELSIYGAHLMCRIIKNIIPKFRDFKFMKEIFVKLTPEHWVILKIILPQVIFDKISLGGEIIIHKQHLCYYKKRWIRVVLFGLRKLPKCLIAHILNFM
jgi:hypothetical protein